MIDYYSKLINYLSEKKALAQVTTVDKCGSIPTDLGSKMLIDADGLVYGTIGGGALEKKAINTAISILNSDEKITIHNWDLSEDIGMECGGKIKLLFEVLNSKSWTITIFGAGHVANALINNLLALNCQIICVDSRSEWLDKLPESHKIKKIQSANIPEAIAQLPEDAFIAIMTPGHKHDFEVLKESLKRKFPYVGLMGSESKLGWIKENLSNEGFLENDIERFICPIGSKLKSNEPAEIAISVTLQLLQERDKLYLQAADTENSI